MSRTTMYSIRAKFSPSSHMAHINMQTDRQTDMHFLFSRLLRSCCGKRNDRKLLQEKRSDESIGAE